MKINTVFLLPIIVLQICAAIHLYAKGGWKLGTIWVLYALANIMIMILKIQ